MEHKLWARDLVIADSRRTRLAYGRATHRSGARSPVPLRFLVFCKKLATIVRTSKPKMPDCHEIGNHFSIMTPAQIDLITKSFDALWPARRQLAEQFYGRFFELAPDSRRLFPRDMESQKLKLMNTIAAIVGSLDKRDMFQSIISHTGRQHANFGVQPSHFVAFGDALIWGLQQQFGSAFTPEMKQAWIALYDAVQSEMIRAAQTRN